MRKSSFFVIVLLAVVTALSTSCAKLPTAPDAPASSNRDVSSAAVIQTDDPAPDQGVPGFANSVTLAPGQEGTIQAGRFTVVIHKESLKQAATITVLQPDPDVMDVEFEITPAEANDFQVPVQIVADCSHNALEQVMDETMYLWDGQWLEASAVSLDHASRRITTHVHELRNGRVATRGQGSSRKASN